MSEQLIHHDHGAAVASSDHRSSLSDPSRRRATGRHHNDHEKDDQNRDREQRGRRTDVVVLPKFIPKSPVMTVREQTHGSDRAPRTHSPICLDLFAA
jgi:hypothetical protein